MGVSEQLKAAAEARVGRIVDDKYRLERVLGVGGMGAVYSAQHAFTDRWVALKLLHPAVARGANVERFLREAKAAAAIRHPGIADVLDAGRDKGGALYLVFELLDGHELSALIRAGRMTPAGLVEVGCQVLEALAVAHDAGIVHRDIKPANVFLLGDLDRAFTVKVLDFGIARRIERAPGEAEVTQAGAVVGTPYYMSPEQMCGEPVDGRADLWALAVVLFYGLTGQLPFRAQNYVALLTEMLRRGPPSLKMLRPELDDALVAALETALASRIENRFSDARSMLSALSPCRASRGGPLAESTLRFDIARAPTAAPTAADEIAEVPPPEGPAQWEQALSAIEGEIDALEKRRDEADPPPRRGLRAWLDKKKKR